MDNHFPSPPSAKSIRCLLTSVILDEWWLVKSYNGDLGVGGFNSTGTHGVRTFCSTPIAKRVGATTVETMDGITVILVGSIDRPKTLNNGFPPEVAYHFHNGFPYYWEKYAPQCSGEESSMMPSIFDDPQASSDNINPATLFDLPVSRMRGLSVSSVDNHSLATEIFNSVLEYYGVKDAKDDRKNRHDSCSTSEENLFKRRRAELMPHQNEEDHLNGINGENFPQVSQPKMSAPDTKREESKLTKSNNEVDILDAKESSVKTPTIKLQRTMKTPNTRASVVLTRSRSRMMNNHRTE